MFFQQSGKQLCQKPADLDLEWFQKRINPRSAGKWLFHILTLYIIETPLDAFANRAEPDQAALVRGA